MEQLQVLSRSRPVRIAFFVALDKNADPVLDAIFQCAFSLWGGRFSMIVPCAEGSPLPNYLPWLKAFDADLIYSYVRMSEAQEARIHEDYYPSELTYHPIDDPARLRPALPFGPLSVVTVLPWASLPHRFDEARGARVIHAFGNQANHRFVINNCGSDFQVLNALRARFAPYGEPLILAEPEEQQNLRGHIRNGEATTPDIPTLLQTMATHPRDRSQASLSAMAAARFSLEDPEWGRSFHLIVGNTPADRILYWNTRAYVPAWRDGDAVDLYLSPEDFENQAFLAALGEFLARRNHVSDGFGNASPRVSLRSISLTVEQLTPFAEQLRERVRSQAIDCEQVASLDHCIPTAETLARAGLAVGGGSRRAGHWRESYVSDASFRLTPPQPDHLRALPRELLTPETGAWAVDLDIERSINHSQYDNVQHRWRLPRRLRVTEAFCRSYQLLPPHGRQVDPRTSEEGFLTAFAAGDEPLPSITLPTDDEAIRVALQRGRDWLPIQQPENAERQRPEQLCYAAERSDAGQHFYGVYQMFGSLHMARSMALHQFWRKQFDKLGATERRTEIRHQRVVRQIQRRLRSEAFDLSQAPQREALANLVLQEADAERMTTPSLKWSELASDFEEVIDLHMKEHPGRAPEPREEGEERRSLRDGLRESVQRACGLGILHQGYELKCPKCLHRNWIALADLKAKVHCQVCHHPNVAPVDQPWQFRMNGFLREALQRHGVGPLLWVLARYHKTLRSTSLWFDGPLNIYSDLGSYQRRQPAGDVDLTIVLDGKVTMCEAKASARGLDKPRETAELFAKLRPDIALLAVMEAPSAALKAKFDEFSAVLAGTGIEPKLWTLDEAADFEDAPWF
jgi:hypothetical protein